ncbi:hypothetical protein IMSAGC001_04116 [Bacteroides acidifaciens]|uniref:Uncharacterized protein n=1 Tax=Bacteroides acidifaciens TaxID=85831 RepID=A0A7J0A950_9BACE|nr:hypothetical protein IMSAGC001_04116 [Bacteroides acidifaciens]
MQTAFVADGVLEGLVTAFAELSRSSFHVLFCQSGGYVARNQLILRHYVRTQPDAHGVILSHHGGVTHTRHTLNLRNQVDFRIVLDERFRIRVGFVIEGEYHQHGGLAFLCCHTDFGHFGGEQSLRHRNTVLHIDGSHVRVCPLFEVDGDFAGTCVGGGRGHVHHVFHTVDLFLERGNHGVQYGRRAGSRISSPYRHSRGRDVRILGDRQRSQSDGPQDYYQDRNNG